jgi:hypothetical protein
MEKTDEEEAVEKEQRKKKENWKSKEKEIYGKGEVDNIFYFLFYFNCK